MANTAPSEISSLNDETSSALAEIKDSPDKGWNITPGPSHMDDPLLSCLVTLTHLLERPASAESLKAGLPLDDGKLTPELFSRAAARAGLSARLVRRDLDDIADLTLPCVLLLKDKRACVLVRRTRAGKSVVVMPETGRGSVDMSNAELENLYGGYAIFARPELHQDRVGETREEELKHGWFWGVLISNWRVYIQVVIAAVMINMFALASPLFIMNVYDRVVPNNAFDTLWVLAIGAFTVFSFEFILKTLRGYFVDSAGRVSDIKIASKIFQQVLGIRMAARPASSGAFANNLREYESLREFFTSATVTAIVDLPFVFFFLIVISFIGGPVAVVPLVAVPIVLIVAILMQFPLHKIVKQSFQEAAQKHGVLIEAINGLETIKAVSAEGRMQRNWERYVTATARTSTKARLVSAVTVNFSAYATQLVTVFLVIVGVYQISEGNMTMGALVACTMLTGRAMAPLGQVAGLLTRFSQSRTSLDSLNQIMQMPVERPPSQNFLHRPNFRGEIEFKNVSLTYPGQKMPALSNVSFKIRAGERIGLIGRIGSGKTTIEKLVLGLYQPDDGAVLIDGTDIRQIDPADLRRNIGCVPQDVYLFAGTVKENIVIGAPYADDEMVLRAAQISGVDDFISRHPSGFDLNVGERGENLSGGQRQSIAVARALINNPPILVLDEPSSAMDNGAESRLKSRLTETVPNRTLILVTHRASLLSLVDRLMVLDAGRVVADGPKDQVLKALASGQVRTEG